MYDNDYLEKVLGEQYNMSNYFADTYTDPNNDIIDSNDVIIDDKPKETLKEKIDKTLDKDINEISKSDEKIENKKIIEHIKDCQIKEETNQQNNIDYTEEDINITNGINELYPEIYTVIEPIVELVVKNNINEEINSDLIESLTRKIYYAIEIDQEEKTNPSDAIPVSGRPVNIKRKPQNSLLYDLIKILILNNFINNKPQRPIPPPHHHNNHRPPMPPPRSMNVSNNTNYFDTPFPEDE